jgi:hypothetical protein
LYSPFNNPTETYRYYSLPFCRSHATEEEEEEAADEENIDISSVTSGTKREGGLRHKQRLGESIVGDRRETSPYEITFLDSVDWRLLCKTTLQKKELTAFKEAIHNNYFFEMFIEDLPMWGYVGDASGEDPIMGEVQGSQTYLFPHLHFRLGHNGNKIVSAKVTTDVSKLRRNVDFTIISRISPSRSCFSAAGS